MEKKIENGMFCYQCQETAGCRGCTVSGVCGKTPDVAAMQDLLVYVTKGLASVVCQLRAEGQTVDKDINHLITVNMFITVTNANFDKAQATKVASMAHNGYARTMRPAHTMFDGDTIFTMCTNKVKSDVTTVGMIAAQVMEKAVLRGVKSAQGKFGIPSYIDIK